MYWKSERSSEKVAGHELMLWCFR